MAVFVSFLAVYFAVVSRVHVWATGTGAIMIPLMLYPLPLVHAIRHK
jgi:hypothetical protein